MLSGHFLVKFSHLISSYLSGGVEGTTENVASSHPKVPPLRAFGVIIFNRLNFIAC